MDKVTYAGREAFYRLTCAGGVRILAHVSRPDQGRLAAVGERLAMALPLARLHAFDPADGRRVEVHAVISRLRVDFWTLVMVLALAVLGVLLIWPLSSIFTASFIDNTTREPTLGNYARVLGQPYFQAALGNSLIVGVGGMLGAMLLGVPLAALTARYVIVGRDFLATLAVLALVSPPFIGAYAWIMMLGRNGFVRLPLEEIGIEVPSIYGYFGIILVFSLKFYPFVFLLASSSLRTINPSVEEAAEGLGAGPWRRFFGVTLPLVFPAVSAGALLTFVLSLADFGTPAIVGGKVRVLATTAYNLFTSEMTGNPGLASATSVVLIVLSLVVVVLQRASVRRRNVAGNLIRKSAPKQLGPLASAAAHVVCYAIVLASSLPSLVVMYTSFRKTSGPVFKPGYGPRQLRAHPAAKCRRSSATARRTRSISVALIVVLGSLIGYLVARSESRVAGFLDSALFIPYIVPGMVLGLAFVVTFNVKPIEITGTATIIVLMLFIRRLPYSGALQRVDPEADPGSIEEAAVSLGASPARAFMKITLPLMLPGIVAGALMSFITAINELSSSLILYVGRTMTMPVRIYLSVLDGEFGTAAALSTILLVASGAAVYVVYWVSGRNESAFV